MQISLLLLIVAQLCLTLCDPIDYSTPGLPVLHYLLEFAQTHIRCIRDAIQLSHPLSSPSPHSFNLSQHQGLFQWVSTLSHQLAKVLELQLQHQSFQISYHFIGLCHYEQIQWMKTNAKEYKFSLQKKKKKLCWKLVGINLGLNSVLAQRIPGTGEPGGLLSMGSHRVGHDWSDLAAAAKHYSV